MRKSPEETIGSQHLFLAANQSNKISTGAEITNIKGGFLVNVGIRLPFAETGFWDSSTLKTTSRSQPPAKSSSGSVRATENQLSTTRVGSIPAFAHLIFSFCDA